MAHMQKVLLLWQRNACGSLRRDLLIQIKLGKIAQIYRANAIKPEFICWIKSCGQISANKAAVRKIQIVSSQNAKIRLLKAISKWQHYLRTFSKSEKLTRFVKAVYFRYVQNMLHRWVAYNKNEKLKDRRGFLLRHILLRGISSILRNIMHSWSSTTLIAASQQLKLQNKALLLKHQFGKLELRF